MEATKPPDPSFLKTARPIGHPEAETVIRSQANAFEALTPILLALAIVLFLRLMLGENWREHLKTFASAVVGLVALGVLFFLYALAAGVFVTFVSLAMTILHYLMLAMGLLAIVFWIVSKLTTDKKPVMRDTE